MVEVGQKVYSYITTNFGDFPLDMVIVEGEVVSKDVYDNYIIKYNFDTNSLKEIKSDNGEKHSVDNRISASGKYFSLKDDKGEFEWLLVADEKPIFNIWYLNLEDLSCRFGMHIYEMYQQLRERYKELLNLNPNIEKISGLD